MAQAIKRENDRTLIVEAPRIPYWCVIPGGSVPGTKIRIVGRPTHKCRRFHVNFVIGDNVDMFVDENDIAFHYNPRFDHKCIVRNTRVKVWGKEEWAPHRMPFMRNVPFTLIITIEEKCYKTAVNDSHFIDYDHRLPYDRANLLNISGEVVIDRIQFESPLPVVDDCRRNSIPRVIYSKSEGTYMSCVDSVPFDFVDLDQELEQESERINVPGANS